MDRNEILTEIQKTFKNDIIDFFVKSPKRVYIEIKHDSLVRVSLHIFKDLEARFNIASGIDIRHAIEILYHFTLEDINLIISLRVKLPKENPVIDSLTPYFEGANWIERELHELLGVNFTGHPDLRRLLLSDDWPEGVFPLCQDYKEWDKSAIRDRGV